MGHTEEVLPRPEEDAELGNELRRAEEEEVAVVLGADAVGEPHAIMVEPVDATVWEAMPRHRHHAMPRHHVGTLEWCAR